MPKTSLRLFFLLFLLASSAALESSAQCIVADSSFEDFEPDTMFHKNTNRVQNVMDTILYVHGHELSPFMVLWDGTEWTDSFIHARHTFGRWEYSSFPSYLHVPPPLWCGEPVRAIHLYSRTFNFNAGAIAFKLTVPLVKDSFCRIPLVYTYDGAHRLDQKISHKDSMRFNFSVFTADTSEVYRENYKKNGNLISFDTLGNYNFIERVPFAQSGVWQRYWLEFKATPAQNGNDWLILHDGWNHGTLLNFTDAKRMMDLPIRNDTLIYCADTTVYLTQDTIILEDTVWVNRKDNFYYGPYYDSLYFEKIDPNTGFRLPDYRKIIYLAKDVVTDSLSICDYDSITAKAELLEYKPTTYNWSTGDTTMGITIRDEGNYIVGINQGYCSFSDTVNLSHYSKPLFSLGSDTFVCAQDSVQIGVQIVDSAGFVWSSGEDTAFIFVDTTSTNILTITNAHCFASDTIQVTYQALPTINLVDDTIFCSTDSVELDVTTSGIGNFIWQDGKVGARYTLKTPGVYMVKFSDGYCSNFDSISAKTDEPIIFNLGADSSFCEGGKWYRDMSNLAADIYHWNDGSNASNYTSSKTESVWLELTRGKCTTMDTVEITVYPFPVFDLGEDLRICETDSVYVGTDILADKYSWSNGATQKWQWFIQGGKYLLNLERNGCATKDSITINIDSLQVLNLGPDSIFCEEDGVELDGSILNATNYVWNDGSQAPIRIFNQPGTYSLTVSTRSCGDISDTINLETKSCVCRIWIPNAFTPETAIDNLNSTFQPTLNCPIASYNLKIYDRWGALIFETNKLEQGWNGQVDNKTALSGTYLWMLSLQYETGRKVDDFGIVNLLR